MKRIVTIFAVSCALTVHGQAQAEAPRIGVSLDYHEVMRTYELSGRDIADHYDAVGASVLADWEYLRLGLGALHNFGNMITFVESTEERAPDYGIAYLQLSALFKYPFRLGKGSLALWPALGLRGDYNLRYEYTGAGDGTVDPSPHDLMAVAGGGLDYALGSRLALTTALLGAYSLTPSATDGAEAPQAFGVSISAGVLVEL